MYSINQKNTQTQIEENCSILLQRILFFSLHIEHASCSKFCCWGGHCTQWMLAHYHLLPHTLLQWVSRMCCSACVLHNLNTSGIWRVNVMFEKTLETQGENMVIQSLPFWQQMRQMMMNSHAGYGVKEDHIPMTDKTDCACSHWNIKCLENPSSSIVWKMLASHAPSSSYVNKALLWHLQCISNILPVFPVKTDNVQLLKIQMFWRRKRQETAHWLFYLSWQ